VEAINVLSLVLLRRILPQLMLLNGCSSPGTSLLVPHLLPIFVTLRFASLGSFVVALKVLLLVDLLFGMPNLAISSVLTGTPLLGPSVSGVDASTLHK